MKAILSNNRGVALIITILMISIIVVLTLEFNSSMRHELQGAVNSRDNIMLGYIAKSGYNLALALLREDDPNSDSLKDDWALLKDTSSLSESLFESGRFQVEITDLSGKIQINNIIKQGGAYNDDQKGILLRLLTSSLFELEEEEAEDILDNIKDWIDSDDEPTRFGSESTYYQSLDDPYSCRNGKLRSIYEMTQIKGITKKLFYGTNETPGLKEYLTVYGDGSGKININTADKNILMVLSDDLDQEMIDEILQYREDEDNDLGTVLWYKEALGTSEDIINSSLLTVKSSYFEILSRGLKDTAVKELKVVVKRAGNKFSTLSYEII
ncbi:MAG: type II secretion system minor pseudopilin GspK [Desulfobacteraceae bacterium]|jgi:general secretion pathway protein K